MGTVLDPRTSYRLVMAFETATGNRGWTESHSLLADSRAAALRDGSRLVRFRLACLLKSCYLTWAFVRDISPLWLGRECAPTPNPAWPIQGSYGPAGNPPLVPDAAWWFNNVENALLVRSEGAFGLVWSNGWLHGIPDVLTCGQRLAIPILTNPSPPAEPALLDSGNPGNWPVVVGNYLGLVRQLCRIDSARRNDQKLLEGFALTSVKGNTVREHSVGKAFRRVSWYADPPLIQFDPCGAIQGVLRACYRRGCEFYINQTVPTQIVRYFCNAGAIGLPFWSRFMPETGDDRLRLQPGTVGEQPATTFGFRVGNPKWVDLDGTHPAGDAEDFAGLSFAPWMVLGSTTKPPKPLTCLVRPAIELLGGLTEFWLHVGGSFAFAGGNLDLAQPNDGSVRLSGGALLLDLGGGTVLVSGRNVGIPTLGGSVLLSGGNVGIPLLGGSVRLSGGATLFPALTGSVALSGGLLDLPVQGGAFRLSGANVGVPPSGGSFRLSGGALLIDLGGGPLLLSGGNVAVATLGGPVLLEGGIVGIPTLGGSVRLSGGTTLPLHGGTVGFAGGLVPIFQGNGTFLVGGTGNAPGRFTATSSSTLSGIGRSTATASFTAAGDSSAAGIGASTATASFTAAGDSSAAGIGARGEVATFAMAGDSSAAGIGASTATASFTAAGDSSAAGIGAATATASFTAAGDSSAAGIGAATATASFTAAGDSSAAFGAASTFTAAGDSTLSGTGSSSGGGGPAFRSSSSGDVSISAGGTFSITKPAGTVSSDLLLLTITRSGGSLLSVPSGWTVLDSVTAGIGPRVTTWLMWAPGSVSNLTFTDTDFFGSIGYGWLCAAFTGCNTSMQSGFHNHATSSGSGTVNAPSLGTGVIGTATVFETIALGSHNAGTWTASGYTVLQNAGVNQDATLAYDLTEAVTAGSTAAVTCTSTGSTSGQLQACANATITYP